MDWTRQDAYTMQRGPWRVCKALTRGVPRYTLTHDLMMCRWGEIRTTRILGVFDSFEDAKSDVDCRTEVKQEEEA